MKILFGFIFFVSLSVGLALEDTEEYSSEEDMSQTGNLIHVEFEVFGTVQGVFFRKNAQQEGNRLGLRGFCRNTRKGTVSGAVEGPHEAVNKMKHWLQYTGSPMSIISEAIFKNEKVIENYSFPAGMSIERTA